MADPFRIRPLRPRPAGSDLLDLDMMLISGTGSGPDHHYRIRFCTSGPVHHYRIRFCTSGPVHHYRIRFCTSGPVPISMRYPGSAWLERSQIRPASGERVLFHIRHFYSGPDGQWSTRFGSVFGKIQGDSRKFLDRFKSYFGSQISQSLNAVHMYRIQPKSATKGEFFIYFCLWLSVPVGACCPLTFDLVFL